MDCVSFIRGFRLEAKRFCCRSHFFFGGIPFSCCGAFYGLYALALIRDVVVFAPRRQHRMKPAVDVRGRGADVSAHDFVCDLVHQADKLVQLAPEFQVAHAGAAMLAGLEVEGAEPNLPVCRLRDVCELPRDMRRARTSPAAGRAKVKCENAGHGVSNSDKTYRQGSKKPSHSQRRLAFKTPPTAQTAKRTQTSPSKTASQTPRDHARSSNIPSGATTTSWSLKMWMSPWPSSKTKPGCVTLRPI